MFRGGFLSSLLESQMLRKGYLGRKGARCLMFQLKTEGSSTYFVIVLEQKTLYFKLHRSYMRWVLCVAVFTRWPLNCTFLFGALESREKSLCLSPSLWCRINSCYFSICHVFTLQCFLIHFNYAIHSRASRTCLPECRVSNCLVLLLSSDHPGCSTADTLAPFT